jgi:hypothetical protein
VAAFQVTGLEEIIKALEAVPKALDDLRGAYAAIGGIVLPAARREMAGQRHANASRGGSPPAPHSLPGSYRAEALTNMVRIRSDLDYAGVSEFGGSLPKRGYRAGALTAKQAKRRKGSVSGGKLSRSRTRAGLVETHYESRVGGSGRFLHKPPLGGYWGASSYYVYPAIDQKWEAIVQEMETQILAAYDKYVR